jgi:hypothetical protein
MPKQQTESQSTVADEQVARQRDSLIGQHVIRALGLPESLHLLQIRPLWGHCFRVNVLIGADAVTARVAHSYFLVTDGRGTVVKSTPAIVRQYGDAEPPAPVVAAS